MSANHLLQVLVLACLCHNAAGSTPLSFVFIDKKRRLPGLLFNCLSGLLWSYNCGFILFYFRSADLHFCYPRRLDPDQPLALGALDLDGVPVEDADEPVAHAPQVFLFTLAPLRSAACFPHERFFPRHVLIPLSRREDRRFFTGREAVPGGWRFRRTPGRRCGAQKKKRKCSHFLFDCLARAFVE